MTAPEAEAVEVVDAEPIVALVMPITGEAIDRDSATHDLAEVVERIGDYMDQLADARREVIAEITRRLDKSNVRTTEVIGYKLTTNAPVNTDYDDEVLRTGVQALIDADVLDASVMDKLYPPPKPTPPPAPKLDKREVNKLVKHPDRAVQVAIATAKKVTPAARTLKIDRLKSGDDA